MKFGIKTLTRLPGGHERKIARKILMHFIYDHIWMRPAFPVDFLHGALNCLQAITNKQKTKSFQLVLNKSILLCINNFFSSVIVWMCRIYQKLCATCLAAYAIWLFSAFFSLRFARSTQNMLTKQFKHLIKASSMAGFYCVSFTVGSKIYVDSNELPIRTGQSKLTTQIFFDPIIRTISYS